MFSLDLSASDIRDERSCFEMTPKQMSRVAVDGKVDITYSIEKKK